MSERPKACKPPRPQAATAGPFASKRCDLRRACLLLQWQGRLPECLACAKRSGGQNVWEWLQLGVLHVTYIADVVKCYYLIVNM